MQNTDDKPGLLVRLLRDDRPGLPGPVLYQNFPYQNERAAGCGSFGPTLKCRNRAGFREVSSMNEGPSMVRMVFAEQYVQEVPREPSLHDNHRRE
jgi:hypothetical protein